jgi:hypothetical protein
MNQAENVSFIQAQLTNARWYLDRAGHADGETASLYLHRAHQACEIVTQLLPNLTLGEDSHNSHRDLAVVRERLRLAEGGPALPIQQSLSGDQGRAARARDSRWTYQRASIFEEITTVGQ